MFNFETLEVWKKAIDFADLVYEQTQSFPLKERFRFRKIYADSEELSRTLSGLRKSLFSTLNPQL
jgi:23S rRNA-intervening sequence protein